jgi:hypothetical protein
MSPLVAALYVSILLSAQTVGLPTTDEEGRAYFEKLYHDRSLITSAYLEYRVAYEKDSKSPQLEGSVRNYRLWFDKDRRRVDVQETRPGDPENALSFRYSFSDGVHRFVDSDRSDVVVRQYSSAYLKGENPPLFRGVKGDLIDPRLIGIIGMEFALLQHEQIGQFKALDPPLKIQVDSRPKEKKSEIVISHPDGWSTAYMFTPSSILPIRIVTKFAPNFPDGRPAPECRVELDSEVVSMRNSKGESFDFPRSLKIRRIMDGQLESAETVTVLKADFNVPVDPNDMTWKALNPKVGVGLNIDDEYQGSINVSSRWNGDNFALMAPDIATAEIVTPSASRGSWLRAASWGTLSLGVVLAIILAFVKMANRK